MFLTISEQDKLNNLAAQIVFREDEVYKYQVNIDNYKLILDSLNLNEPAADIAQYIGVDTQNLPTDLPIETVLLINEYNHYNQLSFLYKTEHIEQAKSKKLLEVLKAQIPTDQLDALVTEALVKVNAQSVPSA